MRRPGTPDPCGYRSEAFVGVVDCVVLSMLWREKLCVLTELLGLGFRDFEAENGEQSSGSIAAGESVFGDKRPEPKLVILLATESPCEEAREDVRFPIEEADETELWLG